MGRLWLRGAAVMAVIGALGCFFVAGRDGGEQVHGTSQETTTPQATPTHAVVALPYTLPGSGLIVEDVLSYDGVYPEDQSGDTVSQISALMLYNPSERMVDFGALALEKDGKQHYFFVYCLPPGGRCLILEKHRQPFTQGAITECRELSVRWEYQDLKREELNYLGFGQSLTIVNQTSRQQRHVTVWYKQYVHDKGYYLGGVAYSAHVFRLSPNEQRTLMPSHYDAGCCKIVGIEIEK